MNRIREASLDDIPSIYPLCARSFPELAHYSEHDFATLCRYRWRDNPFRTADHPFGLVLEDDDGVVRGFLGLVPCQYWVRGRSVTAASGTLWAVDPQFRSSALSLYRAWLAWGDGHLLVSTTAGEAANQFNARLRCMEPIPLQNFQRRLFWLLHPGRVVEWKLRRAQYPDWVVRSVASPIGRVLLNGAAHIRYGQHRKMVFATPLLPTAPVVQFTDEFDVLGETVRAQYDIMSVRTKEFLHWRHMQRPPFSLPSRVWCCRERGTLHGYVAVQESPPMSQLPGRFTVTDLLYDRRRQGVLESLMHAAFLDVQQQGGVMLEVASVHPEIMDTLLDQSPYVIEVPTCTYWYKAPPGVVQSVCRTGSWWPSGIDGDAHL